MGCDPECHLPRHSPPHGVGASSSSMRMGGEEPSGRNYLRADVVALPGTLTDARFLSGNQRVWSSGPDRSHEGSHRHRDACGQEDQLPEPQGELSANRVQ